MTEFEFEDRIPYLEDPAFLRDLVVGYAHRLINAQAEIDTLRQKVASVERLLEGPPSSN